MTPRPIRVHLTDQQVELAREVARQRAAAGGVREAVGVKRGSYTSFEIEFTGMLTEMAVAQEYGVEPDLTIYNRRKEAGADITLRGWTANIKGTRTFRRPHLIVKAEDLRHDAYILVSVDTDEPNDLTIQGYVTRLDLQQYTPKKFTPESDQESRNVPWRDLRACRPPGGKDTQEEDSTPVRSQPRAPEKPLEPSTYPADAQYPEWWEENIDWKEYIA